MVVLGGGFGGVGAARKLKKADVDVTLVDKHDYHTFQPLLYQVATDLLETSACGHPLRDLFHEQPNVTVHEATVTGIDLAGREVQFAEMAPLTYDYLVLGLGAGVNFFGVEGADRARLPDVHARRRGAPPGARAASGGRRPTGTRRLVEDGALNVVVVGGGPTGIESAGALAELYRSNFAEDYPGDPARTRPASSSSRPGRRSCRCSSPTSVPTRSKALEERGVEVLLGEVVASVEPTRVTLEVGDGDRRAHAGVGRGPAGEPARRSRWASSCSTGDRVPTEPDLSLAGHPEVFAVGDIAWITDTKTDDVLPQLGSVALQAGEHAGENIARLVAGKDTEPFGYHDKGTMATIGRGAAVVQTRGGHTLKGEGGLAGMGCRPPRPAVDRRGPGQGGRRLDVGGVHPRALRPHLGARPTSD